jgi:5-formyltetrahydrofolate cyclo-ligase
VPVPPPADATKAEWRRWARTLPAIDAAATADVVTRLGAFLDALDGPVLGYLALPDEVPIAALRLDATLLPRLGDDGSMTIHRDDGRRERHPLGVEQPTIDAPAVDPADIAAVLVPGRVFDRDGFRLGRGGGHYDRLLPRLAPDVPVVGVTVANRLVDRLPREPHDVPMTHLATEAGVFSTR